MKKMMLWQAILLAMILGIATGLIFEKGIFINQILKPIGDIFIGLIKMLVVPLVFFSLITGITSLNDDFSRMGRIGIRTFLLYLGTTAIAVTIGLVVANILNPGSGLTLPIPEIGSGETKETGSLLSNFMSALKGMIPVNPFDSLGKGAILQIIIFALLLGIAINKTGEKAAPLVNIFNAGASAFHTLTNMVMKVAPIGVFALIAWVTANNGADVLKPLIKLIIACYVASLLHILIAYGGGIYLFSKVSVKRFFKGTFEPFSFAFASASSAGTLPITISSVNKNLGVSRRICDFVLPLGATINMDGTAIYQGVCAIFIAQIYGIDLSTSAYITIILTATLASIGTAGIPGAGLIMLSMVLGSVGLPFEGQALIVGIDRILDMARTSVNVLGDCMVAVLVGEKEKEIS